MFIDQSMTRNVLTIDPETSIAEAAQLLARNHIRHLPVTDRDGRLVGIVTDRDIRSAMPSILLSGEIAGRRKTALSNSK